MPRSVDLNLLHPLRALLEERNVSRAADRMHMSQPAMSAALARLRRHFGDDLLERRGNAFVLTPLAAQLLDRAHSASLSLDRVFAAQSDFDPSTSQREFSIVASDYAVASLAGALAQVLAEEAPSVRIRFVSTTARSVTEAPDSLRDHDGLLIPHGFLTLHHQDLFTDRWVCLVSDDNPLVEAGLSLDLLAELPWVLTFSGPTEFTPAAKQMELLGIEPRTAVVASNFLSLPYIITGTPMIGLVQESLGRMMLRSGGLRLVEAPFPAVPLVEAFWWNTVHDRDPDHIWLRKMLLRAVDKAGLPPLQQP